MTDPAVPGPPPVPARAWAGVLLRMPVFWLALLSVLPVAGSVGRLVHTQAVGAEVEAHAVDVMGEVVRRERTVRSDASPLQMERHHLVLRYTPPGGTERLTRVRVSSERWRSVREGDPIPLRVLPDSPRTTDVFGETVNRWYYELPVIALFLFFAGVIVAATVRDLRAMRRALAQGEVAWGLVTRVTGRGPLRRADLQASAARGGGYTLGRTLWLRPATARRLAAEQWVPVIFAAPPNGTRAFWTGDLPAALPDPDTPRPPRLPFDPMRPNFKPAPSEPPP